MAQERDPHADESESTEIELIPPQEVVGFLIEANDFLQQETEAERQRREELKRELRETMKDVLARHGTKVPADVTTPRGVKLRDYVRATPVIGIPINDAGDTIGVGLTDEIAGADRIVNDTFVGVAEVKGYHIELFDQKTGEQIGRKSAAVIGAGDYAYNARSAKASPYDLQRALHTVTYIDKVLSAHSSSETGDVPVSLPPQE